MNSRAAPVHAELGVGFLGFKLEIKVIVHQAMNWAQCAHYVMAPMYLHIKLPLPNRNEFDLALFRCRI